MILIDTDTLIELLEGNSQVSWTIENFPSDPAIISLTQTELVTYACNNKKPNSRKLDEFLSLFVKIYPSVKSCDLSYQLAKRSCKNGNLLKQLSTSIIASTAIINNIPLYTIFPDYYRGILGLRFFKEGQDNLEVCS